MKAEVEKHKKFRELAESRTNKALEAISRIGNLSNKSLYVWEEEEVRRIIKALRGEISEIENRFNSPKRKSEKKFSL